MSTILLPPTIAIRATLFDKCYLNYSNDSASKTYGFLQFEGTSIFSSSAKFEAVPAKTGLGRVHIKCSSNNKFLRTRTKGDVYISAEADEPEEDETVWSCTLFEAHSDTTEDGNPVKAVLLHVQSKLYAVVADGQDRKYMGFANYAEVFDITDLESLVILPKHVAMKDLKGKYLSVVQDAELSFGSTDVKGTRKSWFEVSSDEHGRVRIKALCYDDDRYFCSTDKCVWCPDDEISTYPETLFWPVKLDKNTFALKSLSDNKFCAEVVVDGDEVFKAAYTSITADCRFTLEELVLSRKIYNTDFDLKKAIIYGETPITMATVNTSSDSQDDDMEFKFAYNDIKSSTWKTSHSWMIGTEVSCSFKVPFIGETGVTLKGKYSGSYEWGGSVTTQTTLETTYKVTVPKETSISVSLIATKGTCDVPYSYYQKDVLYNGKTVVYKKNDGLYTGSNAYNFRYEITALKEPDCYVQ